MKAKTDTKKAAKKSPKIPSIPTPQESQPASSGTSAIDRMNAPEFREAAEAPKKKKATKVFRTPPKEPRVKKAEAPTDPWAVVVNEGKTGATIRIWGFSGLDILRWMGSQEWNIGQAWVALHRLGADRMSAITMADQMHRGFVGTRTPPKLTKEQSAKLEELGTIPGVEE